MGLALRSSGVSCKDNRSLTTVGYHQVLRETALYDVCATRATRRGRHRRATRSLVSTLSADISRWLPLARRYDFASSLACSFFHALPEITIAWNWSVGSRLRMTTNLWINLSALDKLALYALASVFSWVSRERKSSQELPQRKMRNVTRAW